MKIEEISQLIERFDRSKAVKLQIKTGDTEVLLESAGAQVVNPVAEYVSAAMPVEQDAAEKTAVAKNAVEDVSGTPVKAPLVGTFYCAPSPEEKPFVEVGQSVRKGDVVGIIEAMKLMNEITAPVDGVIRCIHAENGNMVEYGEVLMVLE